MEGHGVSKGLCVCRSVDAALRRSIPAFNKDVKNIQARLEDIAFKLRIPQRKPWQGMSDNIAASIALAQQPDKVRLLGLSNFISPQLRQSVAMLNIRRPLLQCSAPI